MRRIDTWFLLLGVLCLIGGMSLGIVMGATHDFSLRPVHAHLNLLGWVTLALFGLAYRGWPDLGRSSLAPLHLILSGSGALLMPFGIWLAITHGQTSLAFLGAFVSLGGALVFLVALLNHLTQPASARAQSHHIRR